ncbi:MAG: TIGR04283 family arsenosugar biosynthesis glycosyltransferase [Pikeienuella sp.]
MGNLLATQMRWEGRQNNPPCFVVSIWSRPAKGDSLQRMISVIIPTLNAASRLGPCLGGVGAGITDGTLSEVIFTDGGSGDDIAEIADLSGAVFVTGPAGRGGQLARAAAIARGEWLLFLHADTVLSPDWPVRVRDHMQRGAGQAGWCTLAFDAKGIAPRCVAGWANLRSRVFGLPYGDQALLIHRSLYREIGGHPDIPLMEDVAIARALGRKRLRCVGVTATTDAERYVRDGWFRRGLKNLTTLLRYLLGASPERLAERY